MENQQKEDELTISAEKVVVKGDAYADLRPLIRSGSKAVEPLIRFIGNLVGLPLDWVNNNLEDMRSRYSKKLDEIPQGRRQLPPIRIGASVVRNAAISAEDSELQEMFAELLASASDSGRVNSTHPAFADVIQGLMPFEAKILKYTKNTHINTFKLEDIKKNFDITTESAELALHVAIGNLVRLGLAQWASGIDFLSLRAWACRKTTLDKTEGNELEFQVKKMEKNIEDIVELQSTREGITITAFGLQFQEVCISWLDI